MAVARPVRPAPTAAPEPATGGPGLSRSGRAVLIALAVISLALLCIVMFPFASALLFAAVLAGAFHPWQEKLAGRLGGRRQLAAILLTVAVTLLLVLPLAALTVTLGKQIVEGGAYVRDTLQQGGVPALVEKLPPSLRGLAEKVTSQLPRTQAEIGEMAGNQSGRAAAAVGGLLRATSNVVLQTALMLVALFFFLVDGPRLVSWLGGVTPLGEKRTHEILSDFRNVSVAVLVSSVATAGVQSAVAFLGYLAVGVPQPLFFAAATFVVAFIPAVGGTSVTLVVAALMFATGRPQAALFLAGWGLLVVGFVDNLVKPLLMRGRMEVHGAVIFFALLGGLAAFGPVGLVAGPLILAFFLAIIRICNRDLALPSS